MNLAAHRNGYLIWAFALLLLSFGKVYEWAYPAFQHDYGHFLKNSIQDEVKDFYVTAQKRHREIRALLNVQDSQSVVDYTPLVQHLTEAVPLNSILYEDGVAKYWTGSEVFSYESWHVDEHFAGLHILRHLDAYYLFKRDAFSRLGKNLTLVSFASLTAANSATASTAIVPHSNPQPGLSIRNPDTPHSPLGKLQIEDNYLAPVYGNVLIFFYLLVLLLFYLPFHRVSRDHYQQHNYPWGNLVLLTGVLVTASMCQWIVHQNEFYHSLLTDQLIHTRFYDYTLFEFTTFSGLFFHLSYFFFKYARFTEKALPPWAVLLIALFNYLVALSALVFYCFIFNAVFVHSDFYFDLGNIFSYDFRHFTLLFDLLVLLIGIFLVTNKLTASTYSLQVPFRKRFGIYVLALGIGLPLIHHTGLQLSLAAFVLGASIIIWLQDFFTEDYQKNILWLISWIIVISILNAGLIFHFQNQKRRYIKNEMISSYADCVQTGAQDCMAKLIQNCSTNDYDLYFYEDRLLKFSSNVFKPDYAKSQRYLGRDSIRHLRHDGKDVLYVRPAPSQLVILSNPLNSTLKGISLFSYLFTILIVLSYGISLLHQKFRFLPEDLQISISDKPSLKNRIQFYVILGIVISFLIIAITTVFFTRRSENEIYRENLMSKTRNMSHFLESSFRDVQNEFDARSILRTQLKQTSQMVDFSIRFFHPDGFEDNANPTFPGREQSRQLLNPQFYFQYPTYAEDIVVLEHALRPNELCAFRNLFLNNQRIAILQVEALASREMSYSARLANLVNTLLNIYVFLFLIAASLATFLANSITSPLVTLTEKLRSIRLGKTNEVIEWKSQDEIGELIQNYNQMVNQLDESARLLARTERDSAWREMAKQVAHEIKNPLTPMKLSIQYLQQTIRAGTEDISEMANKVCKTLIEQIDSLSKIATEFGNFAKMPQTQNEKLVLNEILSSVHDLFRKREDIDIHLSVPIDELHVFADKDQIIRVLNNLINNAIQAIPDTRRGLIQISLDATAREATISIRDNGEGIPEEMQSKVFLPNFTSKSSGTGLGLAMCQQIVEAANGRIFFRTVPGKGTHFFVELPLMRKPEQGEVI